MWQGAETCSGVKFREVEGENRVHDYQEIKIQENMQARGVGTVPRSIVVVLDDDLVDTIQAGGKYLLLRFPKSRMRSRVIRFGYPKP